jgi:hypothetical protein
VKAAAAVVRPVTVKVTVHRHLSAAPPHDATLLLLLPWRRQDLLLQLAVCTGGQHKMQLPSKQVGWGRRFLAAGTLMACIPSGAAAEKRL